MEKRHILIVGERRVGKSTLIEKLLEYNTKPVYGFFTRSDEPDPEGYHAIYIYPAGSKERPKSEENHIGTCNGRQRQVNPEVFETLGVEYLQNRPDGIIAMDEVGFMESEAPQFCAELLGCLDGDTRVIATVKARKGIEFLEQVRSHPKAEVFEITAENRDALFDELLPYILRWNKEG